MTGSSQRKQIENMNDYNASVNISDDYIFHDPQSTTHDEIVVWYNILLLTAHVDYYIQLRIHSSKLME